MSLDLTYPAVLKTIGDHVMRERTESRAFLAWFLQHFYRLDEIEVHDCICDGQNDQGVDGIYVNDQLDHVDIFQATIAQGPKTLGDVNLKEFSGSLSQFLDPVSVRHIRESSKNTELVGILKDNDIESKIARGFKVRGIFLTNMERDHNATSFLNVSPHIVLYDRSELNRSYISINKTGPIQTEISFSIANVNHLEHAIGTDLKMVIAPISAQELVKIEGIENGDLFAWNVRQWLGRRTGVNKDIEKSIKDKTEHMYFPAFHNGLTVLCEQLDVDGSRLKIAGYAVVNGCQSLTGFYENRNHLTNELRILTKFIEIRPNSDLALKITDHTNNQNGTTHRDLQSNTLIQTRLQTEVHQKYKEDRFYRIKRGENPAWPSDKVIENELAGLILLAFDLKDPSSSHQKYKLFDEFHADIFGRPEVNADRIVILHDLYESVANTMNTMTNRLFGSYKSTRFFLVYLVREALEGDNKGRRFCQNPSEFRNMRDTLRKDIFPPLVKPIIRVLDNEATRRDELENGGFDYKRELKSPKAVQEMKGRIISQYQVILDNDYAPSFSKLLEKFSS